MQCEEFLSTGEFHLVYYLVEWIVVSECMVIDSGFFVVVVAMRLRVGNEKQRPRETPKQRVVC